VLRVPCDILVVTILSKDTQLYVTCIKSVCCVRLVAAVSPAVLIIFNSPINGRHFCDISSMYIMDVTHVAGVRTISATLHRHVTDDVTDPTGTMTARWMTSRRGHGHVVSWAAGSHPDHRSATENHRDCKRSYQHPPAAAAAGDLTYSWLYYIRRPTRPGHPSLGRRNEYHYQ